MRFARKLASIWTDRWLVWLIVASLVLPPTFYGLVAHQSRVATFAAADQQLVASSLLGVGRAASQDRAVVLPAPCGRSIRSWTPPHADLRELGGLMRSACLCPCR